MAKISDIAKSKMAVQYNCESPGNVLANKDKHTGNRTKYLGDVLELISWPKIDTSDADAVNRRIDEYLRFCFDHDAMPTITGASLALGVARETLWTWETGKYRASGHSNAVKKIRFAVEETMARMLSESKMNPAAGIFLLKNWYGYKDNVDINVTPKVSMSEQLPAETLEAQLEDLPE